MGALSFRKTFRRVAVYLFKSLINKNALLDKTDFGDNDLLWSPFTCIKVVRTK